MKTIVNVRFEMNDDGLNKIVDDIGIKRYRQAIKSFYEDELHHFKDDTSTFKITKITVKEDD